MDGPGYQGYLGSIFVLHRGQRGMPNIPDGSMDPNSEVLWPKYYNVNGVWALKPYYLGPWTWGLLQALVAEFPPCKRCCLVLAEEAVGSRGT